MLGSCQNFAVTDAVWIHLVGTWQSNGVSFDAFFFFFFPILLALVAYACNAASCDKLGRFDILTFDWKLYESWGGGTMDQFFFLQDKGRAYGTCYMGGKSAKSEYLIGIKFT